MENISSGLSKFFVVVLIIIYWVSPDLLPGPIDDIILMVYLLGKR